MTQWRWAKIGLFAVFLIWVKDGTVDPITFQPLAIAMVASLAACSLLDVVLMLLPARVLAQPVRNRKPGKNSEPLEAKQ